MSKSKPIPLYVFRPYGWNEEQFHLNCLLFYEKHLLIGSGDGQIFWYNLKTLRPGRPLLPNLGSSCLQLLRSGCYLVSQSKEGDVSLWSQREGDSCIRQSKVDTAHSGYCRMQTLKAGSVSNAVACATGQSDLIVYSVNEGKFVEVCQLKLPESERTRAGVITCFSAVGTDKVVTLHEANVMYLWDARQSCEPCHRLDIKDGLGDSEGSSVPVAVDFDIHTQRGVYVGMTEVLGAFTTEGQALKQFQTKYPLKMTNKGALSVSIQQPEFAVTKSRIVAVGCCDGSVRVYSWSTGRPLAVMPHSDGITSVHDVAFSTLPLEPLNSERVIAAAGADSCISFWSSDFTRKT